MITRLTILLVLLQASLAVAGIRAVLVVVSGVRRDNVVNLDLGWRL